MGSEFELVEERLKTFLGRLQTEFAILDRIVYKNKNQHRRCSYFQYLLKVRRDLRLLQSAKLEEILNSCFLVIHGKRPKQKLQLLESLKRRRCDGGKYNFLERLLGVARLLSKMVEPLLKAAVDISKLLAQSFFMGFSLTILSLLARLRVLIQQILLDVVCVYGSVSSLSRKEQAIKITEEGFEVFREYYPIKEQFISLECIWQTDKYILVEKMNESESKTQGKDGREDVSQGASPVQYQSIEVLLGDYETGKAYPEAAVEGPDGMTKDNGSLADPVSQSNEEKHLRDGSSSAGPTANSNMALEGGLLTTSSSSPHSNPLKRKAGKEKVAFMSVRAPSPSTSNKLDSGFKLTDKVDEQKEDPFFSLLTGGNKNTSVF
ncbi:uncharacterized protein [Coffea arabica]|uniref:Uncharacterized protein LOC113731742 n=1 Tax=Coffea arabica TaxID=13443 RepID=A0A6P6WGT7_COFAR|nr:uncharacterized protein LOC113731742 [Coffea arabica]XP_027112952.1 uncharacterized protein LOC113731742 [Coffea arabica]